MYRPPLSAVVVVAGDQTTKEILEFLQSKINLPPNIVELTISMGVDQIMEVEAKFHASPKEKPPTVNVHVGPPVGDSVVQASLARFMRENPPFDRRKWEDQYLTRWPARQSGKTIRNLGAPYGGKLKGQMAQSNTAIEEYFANWRNGNGPGPEVVSKPHRFERVWYDEAPPRVQHNLDGVVWVDVDEAKGEDQTAVGAYLLSTCTEPECTLCHTPKALRKPGSFHSGIVPGMTSEAPPAQPVLTVDPKATPAKGSPPVEGQCNKCCDGARCKRLETCLCYHRPFGKVSVP